MKKATSAADLLSNGISLQLNSKFPEAYQIYLHAASTAVEELKSYPSFPGIKAAREALNRAEDILNLLARESILEQPQGAGSHSTAMPSMVIPVSPLVKSLKRFQGAVNEANALYSNALGQCPPVDLKILRAFLQDVEVARMKVEQAQALIASTKSIACYTWDESLFAKHISNIARALYSKIQPATDILVSSLKEINLAVFRFLAFQEYLFAMFSFICAETERTTSNQKESSSTVDFIVGVAYSSLFKEFDIETCYTILQVIDTNPLLFSPQYLTSSSKEKLKTLKDMFVDGSIEIHAELIVDMVKAHSSCIIPSVSAFVKASVLAYEVKSMEKEAKLFEYYTKVLVSARGNASSLFESNDTLNHWILSQTYHAVYCRNFWSQIIDAAPPMAVSVSLTDISSPAAAIEEAKSTPVAASTPAPEVVVITPEEQPKEMSAEEEIIKRLAALRNK